MGKGGRGCGVASVSLATGRTPASYMYLVKFREDDSLPLSLGCPSYSLNLFVDFFGTQRIIVCWSETADIDQSVH